MEAIHLKNFKEEFWILRRKIAVLSAWKIQNCVEQLESFSKFFHNELPRRASGNTIKILTLQCQDLVLPLPLAIGKEKQNFCAVRYIMRGHFLSWSQAEFSRISFESKIDFGVRI